MLVPVIGLVQVGDQAMADRYTYLPQIGICLLLAWAAAEGAARLGWGRGMWRPGHAPLGSHGRGRWPTDDLLARQRDAVE